MINTFKREQERASAPAVCAASLPPGAPLRFAVLDFETTGGSPGMGDRPTEIGIVLMEGDVVVARFASLMNAGVRVPSFIEQLTGISNAMVAAAPPAAEVMAEAQRFVAGAALLVAHNAAFDKRFWQAEMARLAGAPANDEPAQTQPVAAAFGCTLRLARRLYPEAPSHRLGALASYHRLPSAGRAHRALADAEVAAALLTRIRSDIRQRWGVAEPCHALLLHVQSCPGKALEQAMQRWLAAA